jgi:catalase
MSPTTASSPSLLEDILKGFENLSGPQPGFRPAHAKGILLEGTFTPSSEAQSLSSAPHFTASSTPVTVRFSDFGGIPTIPDADPNAAPRGMAIRFHLASGATTDIVAHSTDGFPVCTAEEFLEFLHAIYASGPGAEHPLPIETFLGTHPAALAFVQTPKPVPASFATESFYGVNAFGFSSGDGPIQYGRYRIRPAAGNEYLDTDTATHQSPDFLYEDIRKRLAEGPVTMTVSAQLAAAGDVVNDATVHWPVDRIEIGLGTIRLTSVSANNAEAQRGIFFDPVPRVEGIVSSSDPLIEARSAIYLLSGTRRQSMPAAYDLDPKQVEELAYQLWEERGSPHGSSEDDWHRAEEQLRARTANL